jgi:hypothetical protein
MNKYCLERNVTISILAGQMLREQHLGPRVSVLCTHLDSSAINLNAYKALAEATRTPVAVHHLRTRLLS